ncbi:MAG: hypothetical protein M0Z67_16240 [Nitrospiraceae bacterium]|nr:hypothetical protein [Nitrospiraceae bacterium]
MCYKRFTLKNHPQEATPLGLITLFAAIVIFAAAIAGPHSSAAQARPVAGEASGTLTVDGKSIALRYSYAMAQPNTFDKGKTDIAVLLTEDPLAGDALKDIEDLRDATHEIHGWAYFKINDQGKPIHEVIDHPAAGGNVLMMSGFTHAEFAPKKMKKSKVAGSFTTSKAEDFVGHKYEIKVDFSAPLLQAKRPEPLPDAKTGKALPRDGGEPGKAYMAYLKAIRDNDIAALRKTNLASKMQNATDEELKRGIEFLAAMTPADAKVTRGYVKGDKAVLYLEGTQEGEKQYGTVEFAREKKAWYIVKENWSNTPPGK